MNIQLTIEQKLKEKFSTQFLNVINESHMHSVPKGSESHFRIEIVAKEFENLNLLKRHRLVQELLTHELSQIKACSLHTLTPIEWEKKNGKLATSPTCQGGSKVKS